MTQRAATTQRTSSTFRAIKIVTWPLNAVLVVTLFLIVSVLISVFVELLGIGFGWWDEPGSLHSRNMLQQEIGYLNSDFQTWYFALPTTGVARLVSQAIYGLVFKLVPVGELLSWAIKPHTGMVAGTAREVYSIREYFIAAGYTVQLFGVRLCVLIMMLPANILIFIAAFSDGLVERQLRIYGGGHESSFVYHRVKVWVIPLFLLPWFIYLSIPISVHPNWIYLPPLILMGILLYFSVSKFKKYL